MIKRWSLGVAAVLALGASACGNAELETEEGTGKINENLVGSNFVPDPVNLCLDSQGNPVSASIKRLSFDTYSVTADNAQGASPPLTGRPFRTTSFRPKGSYMTAKLEFSFSGLTAEQETAWRAAFAAGQLVFIALRMDGTTTTEELGIRLCTTTAPPI
jgi:hypothetical protein